MAKSGRQFQRVPINFCFILEEPAFKNLLSRRHMANREIYCRLKASGFLNSGEKFVKV